MKAEKIITNTQEIDLDVEGITLLSKDEATEVSSNIMSAGVSWWLRSPGANAIRVMVVVDDGMICTYGDHVARCHGVRPVLRISNLQSSGLQIGDRFALAGERWIVISKNKALCSRVVGESQFCEDEFVPDPNGYELSDVKGWLEAWAKKKGICGLVEE